jgi:hypothetical protein
MPSRSPFRPFENPRSHGVELMLDDSCSATLAGKRSKRRPNGSARVMRHSDHYSSLEMTALGQSRQIYTAVTPLAVITRHDAAISVAAPLSCTSGITRGQGDFIYSRFLSYQHTHTRTLFLSLSLSLSHPGNAKEERINSSFRGDTGGSTERGAPSS